MADLYRHFDEDGVLLYVGISFGAIARLQEHKIKSGWFDRIAMVTIDKFDTREESLEAERMAIISENPKHNVVHRKKKVSVVRGERCDHPRTLSFRVWDAARSIGEPWDDRMTV